MVSSKVVGQAHVWTSRIPGTFYEDEIVLASSIMLANILSFERQFEEGVEFYKAVGKNGRQHQDPMQQASCNPPKTLVVIVIAIAGHR